LNEIIRALAIEIVRSVEVIISMQTFWIALGAIGTVVTLFFIQRQLRHARYVSAFEFLRREDDRFRTDEMRKHRSDLATTLLLYSTDFQKIDDVADFLLDYFEDLGIILRKRLAPGYLVWSMNCYYVLRYWHALLPYVAWVRAKWNDTCYYSDFEYLYRALARKQRRETGREIIEPDYNELRDFLKEELGVEIRFSASSDVTQIVRVEKEAFETNGYPESQMRELQSEHPDGFFVAELRGSLIGYIIGYVSDAEGELDSIAVDLRYRKLGIGKRLAERLFEKFQNQGITRCSLDVRTSDVGAIKFYERLGFKIRRTEKKYYPDGGDAYIMEIALSSTK
jgi:ribosomal-protein-alanine N-acetyltransferase